MASITTARRRQQEFDGAGSKHELDQIQDRWDEEDARALQAKTVEARRIDDLSHRLRRLEAFVTAMPKATGEVIGRHVQKALEAHPGMVYRGVWDATVAYPSGTVITDKGSAWVSITPAKAGERPSRATCWRLMAKGAPEQQGTVA